MPNVTHNSKHIRIKSTEIQGQIDYIKNNFGNQTENNIINEALRFGLPILLKHLQTPGGLKPSSDPKYDEILNRLNLLEEKMNDANNSIENVQEKQLVSMAIQEVDEKIISSIYSRIKSFISEQPFARDISDAEDNIMDSRVPKQFREMKDKYLNSVLADNEGDDNDE